MARRDAHAARGGHTGHTGRPNAEQTAPRAAHRSSTSAPPGPERCALSSDEQTDASVHARQPAHTGRGRARLSPLRAPRPVHRPAPPGPPGSPARGGPDPHTVTAADGLSDEEERSLTYAWLQRTAWECVSADQRGSGPERTGRTERGRATRVPEDGPGAHAGAEARRRRPAECTQRGGKCAQVVAERCPGASGAVGGVSGALLEWPLVTPENPKKRGAGGPPPPYVPRGLPRTI